MSNINTGAGALESLYQEDGGGTGAEFTSFKSGSTLLVKALGVADLMQFYSYGIFKKVNSFVAKNPSKKSRNGYPVEELTPWDLAWKYHKDLSADFNDKHGQESGKYRVKARFALGLYDLDEGKLIIIDVSKNQAQAIHGVIKKYETRLGKLAFELSKQGEGTSTTVTLAPVLDFDEDLTDKQRENFAKAPEQFDAKLFDGLLYEAEDSEQIDLLVQAGFDISLIGLSQTKADETDNPSAEKLLSEDIDISDDDLPF